MQSRTRETEPAGTVRASRLSAELAAAAAGARRRAVRDGERQADTAHLLHALLEADPEACRVLAEGDAGQVGRLLGYLVQRTIGYGLRWSGSVEDSGALSRLPCDEVPGWSPAATAAMAGALARARARGTGPATGTDLLAALARDSRCRAAEVLGRAGVDTGRVTARLDAVSRHEQQG
ncbi:Clp protease N-terminal domain-containing protein [Streptomyces sp. NPDC046215]|uniref:Clp protease N-terminal domain-containing protein n=1 Tax=Streptomyces sp. NPDC046215 TaxID=3155774 RepID=UPI0033E69583